MRTAKKLKSPEFNDNMDELVKLLRKEKIKFTIKRHQGSTRKVKDVIGYYPAGEWHIMIDHKVSVIRGMASFGDYETYLGKYKEPERFKTAKELIINYKQKYGI